jgi:hypothetical protein
MYTFDSRRAESKVKDMEQQLIAAKNEFLVSAQEEEEAGKKAEQEAKLRYDKAAEWRRKAGAIDVLLGAPGGVEPESPASAIATEMADAGVFTPVKAYWRPLLQVLLDLGGRGRRTTVIDLVGETMKGTLTPADYAKLPNSDVIRWRNRVAWQASNMRSQGLMKKDSSRRGIWEITDAGRKWLDDAKN